MNSVAMLRQQLGELLYEQQNRMSAQARAAEVSIRLDAETAARDAFFLKAAEQKKRMLEAKELYADIQVVSLPDPPPLTNMADYYQLNKLYNQLLANNGKPPAPLFFGNLVEQKPVESGVQDVQQQDFERTISFED